MLKPSSLVAVVDILLKIRGELTERYNYIANWLYCLRDQSQLVIQNPEEEIEVHQEEEESPHGHLDIGSAKRRRLDRKDPAAGSVRKLSKRSAREHQRTDSRTNFSFQLDTAMDSSSRIRSWIESV